MLAASFFFAMMAAVAKWLSRDYSAVQQVFFRNIVGVVFISVSMLKRPVRQRGGKPWVLVSRGVIGTLALYLFFYAIGSIGLGRAVVYQYTYPVFLALLSWSIVGERLEGKDWLAIAVGFGGILFVFRPELSFSLRSQFIGLGNALLTAVAYFTIRQLAEYYDSRMIVMSFMLSGILLPAISMLLGMNNPALLNFDFLFGTFLLPGHAMDWVAFLALGIFALIGQVLMTKAFSYGKSGQIATAGYSNILFSTLLGILMGETLPDTSALIGMTMIIGSGILVSLKTGSSQEKRE